MKTLIAYATTFGCTERATNELKKNLDGETVMVNLKKEPLPELTSFRRVIIGGSIHNGQIQKSVKEFCVKNSDELKTTELGLFICSREEGEVAGKQLLEAFPEELLQNAKATAVFEGEFDFERMNFVQKMIAKKVKHVRNSSSKVDLDAIRKFSKRMDRIFNPFLFLA